MNETVARTATFKIPFYRVALFLVFALLFGAMSVDGAIEESKDDVEYMDNPGFWKALNVYVVLPFMVIAFFMPFATLLIAHPTIFINSDGFRAIRLSGSERFVMWDQVVKAKKAGFYSLRLIGVRVSGEKKWLYIPLHTNNAREYFSSMLALAPENNPIRDVVYRFYADRYGTMSSSSSDPGEPVG
jgi:hypothetical protein